MNKRLTDLLCRILGHRPMEGIQLGDGPLKAERWCRRCGTTLAETEEVVALERKREPVARLQRDGEDILLATEELSRSYVWNFDDTEDDDE